MLEDFVVKAADLLLFAFFSTLILIIAWGALWIRAVKRSNHPLYAAKREEKKEVDNIEPYTIFHAVVDCLKEEKDK